MTTTVASSNECIVQNFHLIWLDSKINETNDDFHHSIIQLKSMVNTINIFTDIDQCIDFLTDILLEKIILIISADLIQSNIFLIHNISQLYDIFIIDNSEILDKQWTKDWWKIRGIFSDINSIYISLEESIRLYDLNIISISLISIDHSLDFNLNKFDQSFLYTHIFKEILFQMNYYEQSIKDFVIYCRNIFIDNNFMLNKIMTFENEYHQKSSVEWYLSEMFIYSMLNRALRTHQINTIMKMSFFIYDLHQQIQKLHSIQFSDKQKSFIVYRGQSLSKDSFKKLMESKDGLISFNNFLSANEDRQVALTFAKNHRNDADSVGILFQITIDTRISTIPYARIDEFINNNDNDQLLFSIHSIFHIEDIKLSEDDNNIWIVDLKITGDNEPLVKVLTKRIRQETQDSIGWHRLGQLLVKLEQFDKAEELYSILIDQCTSDNDEKATLFNTLGQIQQKQGDYFTAMTFYKKELDILNRVEPKPFPRLIDAFSNLGLMSLELGIYSIAFSYFELVLRFQQIIFPKDHPAIAASHTKIGHVYNKMNEYPKALSSYEKTLEIFEKILPPNHPDLAVVNNLIADMYNKMGEYSQAFPFYQKALEIKHKIASSPKSNSTRPSNNIDSLQSNLSEYIETYTNVEATLTLLKKDQPTNNSDLAMYYNNVGLMCNKIDNHSEALMYCEKALKICQTNLPADHLAFSVSYHNIGQIYQSMQEYSQALIFYQKALEITKKNIAQNHKNMADIYASIAGLYMKTLDYSQSLLFYKKVLDIQEKYLPPNDIELALTYNNISMAYNYMGDVESANAFGERFIRLTKLNVE